MRGLLLMMYVAEQSFFLNSTSKRIVNIKQIDLPPIQYIHNLISFKYYFSVSALKAFVALDKQLILETKYWLL